MVKCSAPDSLSMCTASITDVFSIGIMQMVNACRDRLLFLQHCQRTCRAGWLLYHGFGSSVNSMTLKSGSRINIEVFPLPNVTGPSVMTILIDSRNILASFTD